MKINFHLSIVFSLSLAFFASAKDYAYYINDNDDVFQNTTNGGLILRPEKIEEAKKAKDSLPAEKDPDGHWGKPGFGCEASVRFKKNSFMTNDSIVATLIVRNISERESSLSFRPPDVALCFVIIGPGGIALQRTDLPKPKNAREAALLTMNARADDYRLIPGMQRKFEVDLKPHFDFSQAGRYVIYVQPRVLDFEANKYKEIKSGEAVIQITNFTKDIKK